ncbi:hypothetical protein ACFE04_013947 [Oxalis oulophora]
MSTLQIPSSSMNNRNLFCKQTNNNNNMFSSTSSSLSSVFFSNKKQIITRAILVADQKTTTTSKLLDFQVTNPMKLVPDIQVSNELEADQIEEILRRLDAVMEKLVEVEMEKYKRKARKGDDKDLTMEEEEMCREVVRKFLEKPIDYLTSNVGNGTCLRSKQKIKDLWCLVNLLENSYTR